MTTLAIFAAGLGLVGALGVLSLLTVRHQTALPVEVEQLEAIDYLWWDEGLFWAAR